MFIGTIGLIVVGNISFMCVTMYETRKEKKRVDAIEKNKEAYLIKQEEIKA